MTAWERLQLRVWGIRIHADFPLGTLFVCRSEKRAQWLVERLVLGIAEDGRAALVKREHGRTTVTTPGARPALIEVARRETEDDYLECVRCGWTLPLATTAWDELCENEQGGRPCGGFLAVKPDVVRRRGWWG